MSIRHRATLLIPTAQGLLLTETRKGLWLFPGGGIEPGELPLIAAARELKEETDLTALGIRLIEQFHSPAHLHHVFEVTAFEGVARPMSDAKYLHLLSAEDVLSGQLPRHASPATQQLMERHAARLLMRQRPTLNMARMPAKPANSPVPQVMHAR